jgi:transposase
MAGSKLTAAFCGWEGYTLGTIGHPGDDPKAVWVELLPELNRPLICSGCGGVADGVHDFTQRWIKDLPMFDMPVDLLVQRCRVRCPKCGPKLQKLPWLSPFARLTDRMAEAVAKMCRILPVKHVAEHFGLKWDAVKAIDKAYPGRTLGPVDLTGVTELAMDEFAIQKGHRYATVVIDPATRRVLWVGRGRGREDIRPFFTDVLGPDGCKQNKAVAMDMNASFDLEVKMHCPNAEVVYDLFHVVAKYGREVVDRVRVDQANELKDDKPARQVIKRSRWLLLRNACNIDDF